MKVGVLLNHYDVHQVPHVVPYAFELSRLHGDVEVDILSSTAEQEDFARAIGRAYDGHRCRFLRLKVPRWFEAVDGGLSQFVFARKRMALRSSRDLLAGYDVLVLPEMTSSGLKRLPGLGRIKLVSTCHGTGDINRRHDERLRRFDLVFVPGRKERDGLLASGLVDEERMILTGHVKLEAMKRLFREPPGLFDNDRPVVLYNPHHRRGFSSWHEHGRKVLDFFRDSKDYNLIFAPHTLLFKRPWTKGARFPRHYRSTDNMLIDLGSPASMDMTYTRAADIYLGDVSSQVYEFLDEPRPCVFIDAGGGERWRTWRLGPVINDVSQLAAALEEAVAHHAEHYAPLQEEEMAYTIHRGEESAAVTGARAIARLLGLEAEGA